MNRRQFLKSLTSTLAATVVGPALLRRAFGDAAVPTGEAVDVDGKNLPVANAFEKARAGKRGVLVLVIPAEKKTYEAGDDNPWERGRVYGEWLNHGSDAQLAPLGTVEVVAAKMADLRAEIPSLPAGEPLFVLVEPDGSARALHVAVPSYPPFGRRGSAPFDSAIDDAVSKRRIAAVGGLIQRSIAVPAAAVPMLAAQVRAKLVKQRVPGSFWANASGCGSRIEGDEESMMVACGMGHVPAKSSRFLYLYAHTPAQQRKLKKAKSL